MVKIVLIRHAESLLNEAKFKMKSNGLSQKSVFNYFRVNNHFHFIDCGISENASKFSIPQQKINKKTDISKIKVVITSPMFRALQTTNLLFSDGISNNSQNIVVHPFLLPTLNKPYNIPYKWTTDITDFQNFDWSNMNKIERNSFDWLFPQIKSQKLEINFDFSRKNSKTMNLSEKVEFFGSFLNGLFPEKFETVYQKIYKLKLFKFWLQNFIKENNYLDDEVAVVSHNFVIEALFDDNFMTKMRKNEVLYTKNLEFKKCELL